ncbi:MAG: AraC-like DNA-binding protein [Patiriisocius sp.]|jgi:AraC-like DNA-binding protein
MQILNNIPVIGITLGFLILMFIIPDRKNFVQNRLAKIFLICIVIFNIVSQFDLFLFYNNYVDIDLYGITYLFYHLYGLLFYLYISALIDKKGFFKRWIYFAGVFTLLRALIVIVADANIDYNQVPFVYSLPVLVIWIDCYLSLFLNIGFLFAAYKILDRAVFMVELSPQNKINVSWFKRLLLISVFAYVFIVVYGLIADYQGVPWINQVKVESLVINILLFVTAFFAIKFPSFSVHGDSKEDSSIEAPKYSNSRLNEEGSQQIWKKINELMQHDKAYQNSDYRLNDLAESCNKSVHHVSQVINEKSGGSFSDFINKYRIEEAKTQLLSGKTNQLTILAIANEVGFNSKTTFYYAFKKECGMTPSTFMKSQ